MLKYHLFLLGSVLISCSAGAQHPFKFDHTVYKTVYLPEAFRTMDTMQNFLLLDVRTPGEYADTSRATALDIGRLTGSVNITVDSIPARLSELQKFRDRPVFVYCSHSQRSRRVSKLLAEKGFKNIYNINGGMTALNEFDSASLPEKNKWLITNLNYKNISSPDAFHLVKNEPGLVIIDIRTKAEFLSKDSIPGHNIGHLKNAINIPQAEFAEMFGAAGIPPNSTILLYDLQGFNSMDVVGIIRARGFTKIYNLFEGLQGFLSNHHLSQADFSQIYADPPAFRMVDPKKAIDLIREEPDLVILDTRTIEEFKNQSKLTYQNLGHIKNAVHVPSADSLTILISQKNKSTPFLIYNSRPDAATCNELIRRGYTNVNLLTPGLYDFVWSTANIEDCAVGRDYLVDHAGLY